MHVNWYNRISQHALWYNKIYHCKLVVRNIIHQCPTLRTIIVTVQHLFLWTILCFFQKSRLIWLYLGYFRPTLKKRVISVIVVCWPTHDFMCILVSSIQLILHLKHLLHQIFASIHFEVKTKASQLTLYKYIMDLLVMQHII